MTFSTDMSINRIVLDSFPALLSRQDRKQNGPHKKCGPLFFGNVVCDLRFGFLVNTSQKPTALTVNGFSQNPRFIDAFSFATHI